jgi:hypothetical protein
MISGADMPDLAAIPGVAELWELTLGDLAVGVALIDGLPTSRTLASPGPTSSSNRRGCPARTAPPASPR